MVKLNIGSGTDAPLEGYISIDRKLGQEAYPLAGWADGSVDEVYASHILEHFDASKVQCVIDEWTRVLKPGGRLRIAVPDFRWCAAKYLEGCTDMPIHSFILGGQTDSDDYHRALFDEMGLRWQLEKAGLVGVQRWKSENKDCASFQCSLNLEGYKPMNLGTIGQRVVMVATMPRLNWTYNRDLASSVCFKLGIPYLCTSGAYFDQNMERALDQGIASGREYIISMDYDSVFTAEDVQRLVVLMDRYPEASAIAAMQAKRGPDSLALIARNEGDPVSIGEAAGDIFRVKSAHFGLTIMRASVLKEMPRPWLHHKPAPDGTWGDGRVDADVAFWHKLNTVGQVFVSPRVNIGHLQVMVSWVDGAFGVVNQHLEEYQKAGKPVNVRG